MVAGTTILNEKLPLLDDDFDIEIPAGIAPEAYYDSQLTPLRAAIRRFLLPYIRSETPILHRMQVNPSLPSSLPPSSLFFFLIMLLFKMQQRKRVNHSENFINWKT